MRAIVLAAVFAGCGDPRVVFTDPAPEWPDPSDYVPGPGRIYMTNAGDDTVSVVDMQTFEELDRAPVGLVPVEKEGPHHLAITPDAAWAFIGISNFAPGSGSGPHGSHGTGAADGYCLKMSLEDGRVVDEVRVERNPGDVRLMPDGVTILQSHFDLLALQEAAEAGEDLYDATAVLSVIDGVTMQILRRVDTCPAPHGVGVAPDASAAYLACWGSDEIAIVDMESGEYEVTRVPVGADPRVGSPEYGPYALAVSPADGSVWLSCWMSDSRPDAFGEVRRFDPETGEMDLDPILRVTTGNPMFSDFSDDGSRLYVPFQISDYLAVFDPETGDVLAQTSLLDTEACRNVHIATLSPDERSLYVLCEGDHPRSPGTLLDLDPNTLEMRRFVEVGMFPDDIAIVPAR